MVDEQTVDLIRRQMQDMVTNLHLSGKERIHLPKNQWLIGRRNCKCFVSTPMVFKHRVMSHDWHAFSNQWCKASRLVTQLAFDDVDLDDVGFDDVDFGDVRIPVLWADPFSPFEVRPMVLRRYFPAAVSPGSRFLKPMVLRR